MLHISNRPCGLFEGRVANQHRSNLSPNGYMLFRCMQLSRRPNTQTSTAADHHMKTSDFITSYQLTAYTPHHEAHRCTCERSKGLALLKSINPCTALPHQITLSHIFLLPFIDPSPFNYFPIMSVAATRKLLPYKDFTHYLNIPLATQSSRPQLRASFTHFERETSRTIPKGSVLNPDFANLMLARLKLKSQNQIDACTKHLHGLDMHEMLRIAAVNATRGPPNFTSLPYYEEVPLSLGVATTVDNSALKVDISGIHSPTLDPSHTSTLCTSILDRTHRLQHFKHLLLESLSRAGFLATAFHGRMSIVQTILTTGWLSGRSYNPKTRRWTNPGRRKAPTFDASDLIRNWNGFVWATDVQLEKICVIPLGYAEKLPSGGARQKQMKEIDRIPLP